MDKQKQIKEITFKVIDNNTGKEADIGEIALKEDWAKGLMYCDMQGFALLENGSLVLLDECGKYEYCPSDRFTIIPENAVVLTKEQEDKIFNDYAEYIKKVRKETKKKIYKGLCKKWSKMKSCILVNNESEDLKDLIDEICKELGG